MNMFKRFLLVCGALFTALSCSSSTKTLSTSSTEKVKAGKEFIVNLKCNPSTGYSWTLANKAEAAADSVGRKFIADESKPRMMGAGGTEEWKFKAKDKGADSLVFIYQRPFDKDATPIDTMVFHFKVK